jgi:hypothetical protein
LKRPAIFLPEPVERRIRFKCHGRSMARGKSFVERRCGMELLDNVSWEYKFRHDQHPLYNWL